MKEAIKSAIKSGHGNAIMYAGLSGLLISDIVPTPADALYFSLMQKEKKKLEDKKISPKQYWTREAILYYGLNPIWWALVLSAVYFTKGGLNEKVKVGISIIGAGAVIGVINKNIKKDELNI